MDALASITSALPTPPAQTGVDVQELRAELEEIAVEALRAGLEGLPIHEAVRDPAYVALADFHRGLRDALLLEIPQELQPWVKGIATQSTGGPSVEAFFDQMVQRAAASTPVDHEASPEQLQAALAELMLFETVRLRLLVAAWSSVEFESLGGSESDIDEIAGIEVEVLLHEPMLADPEVRPLAVMVASASVALARDAADRADELRHVSESERERLRMQARLRAALRELRLPESILLQNALANLLGEDRLELPDLQAEHPVALGGLSRQAMDQRVSRGRRALTQPSSQWPSRRRPSLFDLLRAPDPDPVLEPAS